MKKIVYEVKSFFLEKWQETITALDAVLGNPTHKYYVLALVIMLDMLLAWLIALIDVGIWHRTASVSGLFKLYGKQEYTYPVGWFLALTLLLVIGCYFAIINMGAGNTGRNFSLSKSNVYGTGRAITKSEIKTVAEISHKDAAMGTILGQLDKTGTRVISTKDKTTLPNNNQLIIGTPGTGKSFSYVINYITQSIRRGESVICSDTKGEVYAETVELARLHGYTVRRLDLKNPACSDGWDVLKELRNDDMRALIFAKIVMANTGDANDIHASAEESLLKACCLFKERLPNQPESERTFYNAFKLLLQGAENLDALFREAASAYPEYMMAAMDAYSTFLYGSDKLRGNIISGLANRLQILASPPVREMTSTPDIDFTLPGKERCIYYISMSDQHETMSFLATLAFSFAFLDLVDFADEQLSQKLPVKVNFLLEEFGNLGRIPNIQKYLSTARSRGISINLIIQSIGQLKQIYEEEVTNTILADCATWMCIGCNDKPTAELLEWRSGEATVGVKTEQHDAVEPALKLGYKHSTGDGRRNFYTSNEIMKMPPRMVLVIWQRMDSLMCHAFGMNQHREYQLGHMPVVTANSLIPLSNKKARQYFHEQEEARIRDYNTWVANGGDPWRGYKTPGPTTTGPASGTDIPDIIPIHVLERMALAYAEGEEYNIALDEEYQERMKSKEDTDMIADNPENEILDLGNLIFETAPGTVSEAPPSDATQPAVKLEQAVEMEPDTTPSNNPKEDQGATQTQQPESEVCQDKAQLAASTGNTLMRKRRPAVVKPPEQKPVPLEDDTRAPEDRPLECNIPERAPSLTDIYGMPGQPLPPKEGKGTGKLSGKKETRQFQKE